LYNPISEQTAKTKESTMYCNEFEQTLFVPLPTSLWHADYYHHQDEERTPVISDFSRSRSCSDTSDNSFSSLSIPHDNNSPSDNDDDSSTTFHYIGRIATPVTFLFNNNQQQQQRTASSSTTTTTTIRGKRRRLFQRKDEHRQQQPQQQAQDHQQQQNHPVMCYLSPSSRT
jgi:hypothetical protein